jgi:hypothetical protein
MEDRVVPNTAPYAPDEMWWTHAGQTVSIWPGVSDDDGDPLSLSIGQPPSNGTVTTDGYNDFTYTPNPDFVGTDSFTYAASDGFPDGTSTGTITISVDNTAPSAPDELWWTHAGQSVSIWPGVSDDDGDGLTLAVASQPGHGTVTTDGYNEFLYTPNPDFVGTDSFTYSASDGFPGGTSTGTITVTVEPPFVTIESWQGTIEGSQTPGWFRFTRTGPTVSDLTVNYTIDDPTEFEVATPGKDYQVLSGSVVIPAGAASVDVPVTPMMDNEFEDDEPVQITLVAPPPETARYQIDEATATQIVMITDDPPQVMATAVWEQVGDEIGQITLTRSGGNINEALTVWFEPEGTLYDDGETLTVTMAATAVIPAGQTTLVVPIIADPANGGIANVQMPGATPAAMRADQSQQLTNLINDLDGTLPPGPALVAGIEGLPFPLTYSEHTVLLAFLRDYANADPSLFGTDVVKQLAIQAAQDQVAREVDWRCLPPRAAQAVVGGLGVFAGAITLAPDWSKIETNVNNLIADLGSPVFQTRINAQDSLIDVVNGYVTRGDITRATLVIRQLRANATSPNPEISNRILDEILPVTVKAVRYYPAKLAAVAAVVGGWVLP